jgi:hypothetical protein
MHKTLHDIIKRKERQILLKELAHETQLEREDREEAEAERLHNLSLIGHT